jgi:hypothetical protein
MCPSSSIDAILKDLYGFPLMNRDRRIMTIVTYHKKTMTIVTRLNPIFDFYFGRIAKWAVEAASDWRATGIAFVGGEALIAWVQI